MLTRLSGPAQPPQFDLYRPALTATLPTILDHAPTTLRHPQLRAGFEIAAASAAGFRASLDRLGFTEIFSPKIVKSATEGGAIGFIADHFDVMAVCRDALAGMVDYVRERGGPAVQQLSATLPDVPAEIPHLHFSEAMELISAATGEDVRDEPDLAPAHERWLCQWAEREHGSELVFITGYPLHSKPFYTYADPERPRYSYGFDLLFRGSEIVTGGQRLHRHEDYLKALAARGLDPAPFGGFLQVFEHGMPPHGGFAIGLERWTARLTGAANLRQVTLFPRDLHRLSP